MLNDIRVLLLEDNEDDALLLINELRAGGFNPFYERVCDRQGMERMLDDRDWDIICSDYKMPQFNASDALKVIYKRGLDIPFIIISGTIGEEIAVDCMRKGAHDYLMKGSLTRLCSAIKRELADCQARKDRALAQNALRESENKYYQLFQNESSATILFDAETMQFIDANKAALMLFGYKKEDFLKLTVIAITDEKDKTLRTIKEISQNIEAARFIKERRLKKSNGSLFFGQINSGSFTSNGRKIIIGAIKDITIQREAEKQIVLLQNLIDNSNDAIFIINPIDSQIIYVNKQASSSLGYSQEELLTMKVTDLDPLVFNKTIWEETILKLRKTGSLVLEGTHKRKDNSTFPVEISSTLSLHDGKEYLIAITRDITERKYQEYLLRDSEEKYKSLVNNINIGISLISPKMEILSLNTQMKKWFPHIDVSKNPICYKSFNVPPKEALCSYCPTCKTLQDGKVHESVSATPEGDKIRHYRIISSPIVSDTGKVIAATEIVEDITDRIATEELNKTLQEQLFHFQKMEAVGTMASGIAHNFNNILGTIQGSTEMVVETLPPDSKALVNLKRVLNGVKSAKELTEQMVSYSKTARQKSIPVEAAPIVINSLNLFRGTIKGTVTIEENIDSDCGFIECEPNHLTHVILNMLQNSFYAVDPYSGIIGVALSKLTLDTKSPTKYALLTRGEYIKITIKDNGCGIDNKIISRIFEPFFTTKGIGKGTGLGLSTAHNVITGCNGNIFVESELDKGSIFEILLPRKLTNETA
ncbi:MAG: hypothetical protein A2267_10680 [Omnitrophica WOR_2 bacterium RIFOXYA12_FULL_38_10]|nr:MAG: hypothetical protein A2267_10680 [Omnitrophica WOR_2 bacterium RIFOXYA12_FULL_38_10]